MKSLFRFYFLRGLQSKSQTMSICTGLLFIMLTATVGVTMGYLSNQNMAVAMIWMLSPAFIFRVYMLMSPYYRAAALKTWG
ncbi:hypothetical protein GT360_08200 [Vibrio astriarenae]|uniref:Uncharacterized protein n=1 Tax=Vibrio astriarenae TaxID=1481923 RepID=A0A7Z2YDZ0_9VIBR|nr:hypothetical protein [Vibrio astriarenae]QIA63500.1 hypothetical protein GT360_08200 [Vibrio astriarenae]